MDNYYTRKAMRVYGGSFIQHLSLLMDFADSENLYKIKKTWAVEIKEYEVMGKKLQERENGQA